MSLHTSKHTPLYFIQSAISIVALAIVGILVTVSLSASGITIDGLGYVTVNNYAYDVRGRINGSTSYNFQTTYANAGYSINFNVDGTDQSIKNVTSGSTYTNHNVKLTVTETQTASGVDVKLAIENPAGNGDHTYRLAITADIQLGSNDYAAIYKKDHDGLVITQDDQRYANDYGAKVFIDFYPSVQTSWIGFYNDRGNNKYNESTASSYTVANHLDTGAAWSWQGTFIDGQESDFITSYKLVETESSTVKFYDKNGNLVSEQSALVGGAVTLPELSTAEDGYIHSWCDSLEGTGVCHSGGETIIAEDTEINFYEVDSLKPYSISYDLAGGTVNTANPTSYNVSSDITLNNPSKTGHTFTGWTGSNGTTPQITVRLNGDTGNKSYTANWSINDYSVTFDAENGTAPTTITGQYGSAFTLPTPERTGYDFAGWYSDAGLTMPYTNPIITDEDITLHAKWAVKQYTVTFNLDGGTGTAPAVSADYGSTIPAPAVPTKEGYTFLGWFYNDIRVALDGPITIPAANAEFTARWQINQYTVSFDLNGGIGSAPSITANYGTAISAPDPSPTREGHTFLGWYEADASAPYEFTTIPAHDVQLQARWQVNQYTIYFDAAGDTEPSSITADYGTVISAPADPVFEGHTFLGWINTASNEPYEFTTIPAEDIHLAADWSINSYSITIDPANGDEPTTITQIYGTPLTLSIPEKTGHTFTGWYADEDLTDEFTSATIPAADLTLYAGWQVNQYTISFNLGDGNIEYITADYGSTFSVNFTPRRTGYEFDGWYLGDIRVDLSGPLTIPASDAEFTAHWKALPAPDPVIPTPTIIPDPSDGRDEPSTPDQNTPADDTSDSDYPSEPLITVSTTDNSRQNDDNDDSDGTIYYLPNGASGNTTDQSNSDNTSRPINQTSGSASEVTPSKIAPLGATSGDGKGFFETAWDIIKTISPALCLILLGFIFFLLFKRRKDEEEREENQQQ